MGKRRKVPCPRPSLPRQQNVSITRQPHKKSAEYLSLRPPPLLVNYSSGLTRGISNPAISSSPLASPSHLHQQPLHSAERPPKYAAAAAEIAECCRARHPGGVRGGVRNPVTSLRKNPKENYYSEFRVRRVGAREGGVGQCRGNNAGPCTLGRCFSERGSVFGRSWIGRISIE